MQACELLGRSKAELDRLYTDAAPDATPASMPDGEARGTAVVCPGSLFAHLIAWLARCLLWQGKVFNARTGKLVNRVSPLSVRAIDATVHGDASWLDGKPCIVIDYSHSSWKIVRPIRDEIREVAPGLYLGKVWWGRKRLVDFTVAFRYEAPPTFGRRFLATAALLVLVLGVYLFTRLTGDEPVRYDNPIEHFKYGSTGGEREAGIPLPIFVLMPELFAKHLPGKGLASLGFVQEPGHGLPVGFSKRRVQGIDRVFLNCAVCHVGTVRMRQDGPREIVVGMPANTLDLQGFERFLFACAKDEEFTADRLVPEIEERHSDDWLNRQIYHFIGIARMRDRLLAIADRFRFMDQEPDCGPGRVDTFNSPKVLLNFPMDRLPEEEQVGLCDFPSLWNQKQREDLKMNLHWDGNNADVRERNLSAAFGTGATPPTLDRNLLDQTEKWLMSGGNRPPDYVKPPEYVRADDAARRKRGEDLYGQYCARCHGQSGTDFAGEKVGAVTPIDAIGTDRYRLDSYSFDLCVNQNLLYAADPNVPKQRFKSFRKTFGYANQPLDGIWLRAPYLHNGSVPTLRELLEPRDKRRAKFFRGCDLYDHERMGFVADVAEEGGRRFFLFDTALRGNGNRGHEGPEYGTELSDADKDAIVEFLKTF